LRFRRAIVVALAAALSAAPVAAAHVTMDPGEWEAGGFGRFDVRVPNERPNATTTEITLQLPEGLEFVSFQDVPGWERSVEMVELDEPIEGEEGEEPITERIGSVTWSGGEVDPGEFVEFGLSFRVPEDAAATELLFPATQTYSNGEVVRWIQPDPEGEEPAPRVAVLAAGGDEPASTGTQEPATQTGGGREPAGGAAEGEGDAEAAAATGDGSDAEGRANLALGLGTAGLVAGLVALAVALARSRRPTPSA
jgi:periplasmic copper chaperone A